MLVVLSPALALENKMSKIRGVGRCTNDSTALDCKARHGRNRISLDVLIPDSASDAAETLTPTSSPTSSVQRTPTLLSPVESPSALRPMICGPPGLSLQDEISSRKGVLCTQPAQIALPAFRPPPGLPSPPGLSSPELLTPGAVLVNPYDLHIKEAVNGSTNGVSTSSSTIGNVTCTRVEWHIADPLRKFKVSCGFPLVSPPFVVGECGEARLVFTGGTLPLAGQRKAATRKANKMIANTCSQYGSVQVKVSESIAVKDSFAHLYYSLGAVRQGPYELETRTLQGCDLTFDWREQLEGDDAGFLHVALELFQVDLR